MRLRLSTLTVAVVVLVTTVAIPAFADPARPTNYESVVLELDPPTPGVDVRVVGGDAFLQVTADPGVSVEIPGYEGEPYVRIDADGTVSVNHNSPAHWLNNDRYAQVPVPPGVSKDSPPDWHQVATDGSWAWHDHRIHWMAPDLPPTADAGTQHQVFEWNVPIQVDGEAVIVTGQLTWLPNVSPLPWILLSVLIAVGVFLLTRRDPATTGFALIGGGVSALVVSLSQQAVTPPGAGAEVVAISAGVLVTLGGIASVVLARSRPGIAGLLEVVAAVILVIWGLQRRSGLWLPVLPTPLPPALERVLTAIAIGIGPATLVSSFLRRLQPAEA